jgi:hypothetical protein
VASKILVALLVLVGMPLLGQLVGLFLHDVDTHNIAGLLGESVLSYGSWLGMAAVIAALTRDLRTFLLALVLVTLGWFIGLQALGFLLNPSMTPGPPPPLVVPVVIVTGMLLTLAHQYATRDVRRGLWIAGALAVGSIVLPLVVPRPAWSVIPASRGVPPHLRLVGLSIEDVRLRGGSKAQLQLRLQGVSPFHQYVLISTVVHLYMPDGSVLSHAINNFRGLNTPQLRLSETLHWLGERPRSRAFTISSSIELSEAQAAALSHGGIRLVLQGQIQVREPSVMADLPLEPGATAAHDGRRVRIAGVGRTLEGPSVNVRISEVLPASAPDFEKLRSGSTWESPFTYALVNWERKQALTLEKRGSSGSSFSLVLPGPYTWMETIRLEPTRHHPEISLARIEDEWLKPSRLLFVKWVPLGSYPVMIESQSPALMESAGSAGPRVRVAPQREPAAEP